MQMPRTHRSGVPTGGLVARMQGILQKNFQRRLDLSQFLIIVKPQLGRASLQLHFHLYALAFHVIDKRLGQAGIG